MVINSKATPTAICGNPYKLSRILSKNRENFEFCCESMTTIGIAIIIANIEDDIAVVNEPKNPSKTLEIKLPPLAPFTTQYESTLIGSNKPKVISIEKKEYANSLPFKLKRIFLDTLGVPLTFWE